MSTKHLPSGFKFDFGSTVTILTTVATGTDYSKNINSQGIFTGIILDESELKLKRDPKHISISVDGMNQLQDSTEPGEENDYETGYKPEDGNDYGADQKPQDEKGQNEWPESGSDKGYDKWPKYEDDKGYDKWPESKDSKDHGKYPEHKDDKCHDDKKKHEHEIEVIEAEEFLILSLTCPSYPFTAGQIVWINISEIVAFAVACRS